MVRRIAASTFEEEAYYSRSLESSELERLVDKFARLVEALLDNFMQSRKTIKGYWYDGNPLRNFVTPPPRVLRPARVGFCGARTRGSGVSRRPAAPTRAASSTRPR